MARSDDGERAVDPTRREFFRTFGRETVRNAGSLMGAASELRRVSGAAARDLLDPGGPGSVETSEIDRAEFVPPNEPAATFRSTYRLAGDSLLLLDQRDLPGRLTIIGCHEPSEVASAIRASVVNGGPVLAEVAAYALSAALADVASAEAAERDQVFRAAATTLRSAAREVHALKAAVDRMEHRYDDLTAESMTDARSNAGQLQAAIRAEADAIASEAQLAHAALGRRGAQIIAAHVQTESISLLMHGDMGPLSCGMVGTGTAVLQALIGLGVGVHVWLTEASPSDQGVRLAALQLTQADVPHTVIADSAVAWLLDSRKLDAVLLRGDTVAANGDVASLIGSLNVARLAAEAEVPVHVLAPLSAFDADMADASSLSPDLRSAAEALAKLPRAEGKSPPAVFGVRLNPTIDVVPRELVTAYLTEDGSRPGGRA